MNITATLLKTTQTALTTVPDTRQTPSTVQAASPARSDQVSLSAEAQEAFAATTQRASNERQAALALITRMFAETPKPAAVPSSSAIEQYAAPAAQVGAVLNLAA